MKVPSTSQIRRSLVAVSFAAVVALTGCSDDQAAQSGASDGGGAQPPASDGGGAEQAAPEADVSDVPDVVAEVNGEKITKDQFVQTYEAQFQQAAMQQQSTGQETDQDELKKQVAGQLVDNELLQQAADDSGITASDEDIDATLEEIAAQNGLGSADEVVQALEEQGMDEKDVRADAASQYALTTYVEQESDIKEPSDKELKAQYDELVAQQDQAGGQESEIPPFEDVKDQLAQQTVSQQQGEAATKLAADLKEKGDVTINL
ncbi:SurA N-terminal domain-containing protein [Brachybacterium alimentarium]|uniref:SurA N-terminal domain-containing protein n=1 Tax=Brachybacterium alimentarium TaxID=47845 RepID=UPI000DF2FD68|nr:SurA N-terminal domain-containing protein [Brachybacterium alimentarium]RCS74775.1 SurA [Brachybacterium alimentarium]RCS79221.1 SurA [Brachybacterium alimentarium]